MNRIYQIKLRNFPFALIVIGALIVSVVSCKKNEYKSPQEYLDEETEILERFYEERQSYHIEGQDTTILTNDSTRLEIMTEAALDTIDHRFESGMMFFRMKQGIGELIPSNRVVGYRFNQYVVLEDKNSVTYISESGGGNYDDVSPALFTTQSLAYSTSQLQQTLSVPVAVNEAVQNMRLGGKARIVMPSPVGFPSSYTTYIYDLEITYVSQE